MAASSTERSPAPVESTVACSSLQSERARCREGTPGITSQRFRGFKMAPTIVIEMCFCALAPSGAGCKNTSRIQNKRVNLISFMIEFARWLLSKARRAAGRRHKYRSSSWSRRKRTAAARRCRWCARNHARSQRLP